jgi:hypothetical protein
MLPVYFSGLAMSSAGFPNLNSDQRPDAIRRWQWIASLTFAILLVASLFAFFIDVHFLPNPAGLRVGCWAGGIFAAMGAAAGLSMYLWPPRSPRDKGPVVRKDPFFRCGVSAVLFGLLGFNAAENVVLPLYTLSGREGTQSATVLAWNGTRRCHGPEAADFPFQNALCFRGLNRGDYPNGKQLVLRGRISLFGIAVDEMHPVPGRS